MVGQNHRYFEQAYRVSDYELDSSVTSLQDGQWLELNSSGKLIVALGSNKAYMTLSSIKTGRDTVNGGSGQAVILVGPYRAETDQWDTAGTYTEGAPLKVKTDGSGVLTPWVGTGGTPDNARLIVGYVTKVPSGPGDTIIFIHE